MPTATITELPISEADVNVNPESSSVELSSKKFNELLEYLTRLEDELSVAKFDLESERRFAWVALRAFVSAISLISASAKETDTQELALELLREFDDRLNQAAKDGSISESHVQGATLLLRRIKRIAEDETDKRYETA